MDSLTSEMIDVPAGEGTADAFFTRPADGGPHPAVILYMDAFGIRPGARGSRAGARGARLLRIRAKRVLPGRPLTRPRGHPDADHGRGSRAAVCDAASQDGRADSRGAQRRLAGVAVVPAGASETSDDGPIGTTGYCLGGRLSLRMAGEFPDDVGAAASFHGGNLATETDDSPHLAAVRARAELYIGHADNDGSMPPEQMGRLATALGEAHVRHTTELYAGAQHGWTQTDTPAYDAPSAARAWMRLFDLFGRTLHA